MVIFRKRRECTRLDYHMPIKYKDIRRFAQVPRGTITEDISEKGIRFISSEFIPPSANLRLEISLPSIIGPIKVFSKVVWIQNRRFGEQYDVGIEFIDISKEDKEYIIDFVKTFT